MSLNKFQNLASKFVALSVLFSVGLSVVPAHADQPVTSYDIPSLYKQWMIGANSRGDLLPGPGHFYNLKNRKRRRFLQYEKQGTWQGINLGWTNNATAQTARVKSKWFFHRPGGDKSPLVYGETIAIAWQRGGISTNKFIRYASRNAGIDLDWSFAPRYEWTIFGGKLGDPIRIGEGWLVIYNKKKCRPLKYFKRKVGGNIGWEDSKRWLGNQIGDGYQNVCF